MPTGLNPKNVLMELRKQGGLMDLLSPEQFADRDGLADNLAKDYLGTKKEMKSTQLRKFFHALKEKERALKKRGDGDPLDHKTRGDILLFVPELAYACARKLIPKDFYDLMCLCLSTQKLQKVGDLRRLMQFLTAILAYHKYHKEIKEGGNNQ